MPSVLQSVEGFHEYAIPDQGGEFPKGFNQVSVMSE